MTDKTGAEIDQAQMVQVRNVLHAAGECHSHETERDVARILRERDELRAQNERLLINLRDYRDKHKCAHAVMCWADEIASKALGRGKDGYD